jgi:hypothetical protein
MTAMLEKTRAEQEQEIHRFVRRLGIGFEGVIRIVHRDAPTKGVWVKLMLPSINVLKPEERGAQADFIDLELDWTEQQIMDAIGSRFDAMIKHELAETFTLDGKPINPPSHDPAVLGSMRHWTSMPNCA